MKASDGYAVLAGSGGGGGKWEGLWKLIGREDLIEDRRYLGEGISGEFYFNFIVPSIEEWSRHVPKLEIAQKLIELGFSMGVVQDAADFGSMSPPGGPQDVRGKRRLAGRPLPHRPNNPITADRVTGHGIQCASPVGPR